MTHRCRRLFLLPKMEGEVAARHTARATKRSMSRAGEPRDLLRLDAIFSAWVGRIANRSRTEDTCEAEKALYSSGRSVDTCCMYPCVKRSVSWVEVRVAAVGAQASRPRRSERER
jgi:hypothetical protein